MFVLLWLARHGDRFQCVFLVSRLSIGVSNIFSFQHHLGFTKTLHSDRIILISVALSTGGDESMERET